jgi:hypothetical protein
MPYRKNHRARAWNPRSELIDELRRRRRTYREIVSVLAEKCDLRVSISTIHDFCASQIERSKEGGEASSNRSAQCRHPQFRPYTASPGCAPVEPG